MKALRTILLVFTALVAISPQTSFAGYDPTKGRLISRDPIHENGGENLYGMVGNRPISRIDFLGLEPRNATPVFNVHRSGLTEGFPDWDTMATERHLGGSRWTSRQIKFGEEDVGDNKGMWVTIESARSKADMWWREGIPKRSFAKQHEERHVEDMRSLWKNLTEKAVSFTGCCKPKGWKDCFQPVIDAYADAYDIVEKSLSSKRHSSNDLLMGYADSLKPRQAELAESMRNIAIERMIKAQLSEQKCNQKFKIPNSSTQSAGQIIDQLIQELTR